MFKTRFRPTFSIGSASQKVESIEAFFRLCKPDLEKHRFSTDSSDCVRIGRARHWLCMYWQ